VTYAVLNVSYGVQKSKLYEGMLGIIGLTTPLLSLSNLVYFGGKQLKVMSLFFGGGSLVLALGLDLGGASVLNSW